jgi:two-component system NtrC family sensor kinase
MNIAVVGGGTRCRNLLDLIERHSFQEIFPKVVAVADKRDNAAGLVKARKKGLFVTKDYNDFFGRVEIDLIIELTGNQDIYDDILRKKRKTVQAVDHRIAELLREISVVYDDQNATRQELRETRARYDVIMNVAINENVMVIAPDYRILDINETLLKKLGLEREEAIGRYCYEVSHYRNAPCSGERQPCPLPEALKSQKPSQTTHSFPDKDDRELFYAVSCYPLFENGDVIGVVGISRNITKDVNIQKVMMQQEKLASIGRLAAGVAHEINNPMTTILTSVMLMQEDTDPADPRYQELQTITDETLRCSKIVTSLLDFARQMKPSKTAHNLNDVVMECVVLTRKQAAFNDVVIEESLSDDLPLTNIDKDKIEQALINLTLNAVEATDPGGKVTLSVKFVPETETFEITVSDSGRGIPNEDMDKIFDPFFTTTKNGTGLGLAITLGIIEQHGGTIDVQSKLGQGTTFTIRLPLDRGDKDVH